MAQSYTVVNEYPNPLDHYRSYSYHFILTISDTTEAFRAMIGGGGAASTTNAAPLLSAINNTSPGNAFTVNKSTAYLLVDTRRFSQFSITGLEMEHMFLGNDKNNPTVPTNLGSMTLIDTTGLTFINMLMDVMRNKLMSTRASSFFLLNIIFSGHKDDGTTETISTTFIPFVLMAMGFNFTSAGSTYTIDFQELESGTAGGQEAAASMHSDYLCDIKSISTEKRGNANDSSSNTLRNMLDELEDQLNLKSLQFFKNFNNDAFKDDAQIKNQTVKNSIDPNAKRYGKLVQYMITIPKEWNNYIPNCVARSKNTEKRFVNEHPIGNAVDKLAGTKDVVTTSSSGNKTYSQISFGETTTITDAVRHILESCQDILALASEDKRKNGMAQVFNVTINTTSDQATYLIHIDVYKEIVPKPPETDEEVAERKKKAASLAKTGVSNSTLDAGPVNLITYDYLYTGMNSHISKLDIDYSPTFGATILDSSAEIGGARAAKVAAAGQTKKDQVAASDPNEKKSSFNPDIRPGDPIFFPIRTKEQQTNNSSQKTEQEQTEQAKAMFAAKQEYLQTLAGLHFLSAMNLTMTVRGNPNIIKKFADANEKGGIAPHLLMMSANDVSAIATSDKNLKLTQTQYSNTVLKALNSAKDQYYRDYYGPRIDSFEASRQAQLTGKPDPLLNGVSLLTFPLYVKVNIRAPNVDAATGQYLNTANGQESQPMYTSKFFWDGAYLVQTVKTTFSNGEFMHEFQMIPYDLDGRFSIGDSTNQAPANVLR